LSKPVVPQHAPVGAFLSLVFPEPTDEHKQFGECSLRGKAIADGVVRSTFGVPLKSDGTSFSNLVGEPPLAFSFSLLGFYEEKSI
jgi:hypothetical protein